MILIVLYGGMRAFVAVVVLFCLKYLFNWKDNPRYSTFLGSSEHLWAQGPLCYAPSGLYRNDNPGVQRKGKWRRLGRLGVGENSLEELPVWIL